MEVLKKLVRDLLVVEIGMVIGYLVFEDSLKAATVAAILITLILSILTSLYDMGKRKSSYHGNLCIEHKPVDDDTESVYYRFEIITPLDDIERMDDIHLKIVNVMNED